MSCGTGFLFGVGAAFRRLDHVDDPAGHEFDACGGGYVAGQVVRRLCAVGEVDEADQVQWLGPAGSCGGGHGAGVTVSRRGSRRGTCGPPLRPTPNKEPAGRSCASLNDCWWNDQLQTFALAPQVLAQQHAPELLQSRWRIIERPDDRLPVTDRQREHPHHPPERILEPTGELGVVHQSRKLQHELIADWETGKVYRTYVLYPASGHCQVAETDVAA